MSNLYYYLLFLSSATAAAGQLLFKQGASGRAGLEIIKSPVLWAGGACYFISTVLWIYALSKVDLSIVYPFTALTFVMVFILCFLILGEPATPMKLLGIFLILGGFLVMFKAG